MVFFNEPQLDSSSTFLSNQIDDFELGLIYRLRLVQTSKSCFWNGSQTPFDHCYWWKSWICSGLCCKITWLWSNHFYAKGNKQDYKDFDTRARAVNITQGRRNICGHVDLSTPYFGTNLWKYPIFECKAMKMLYFWTIFEFCPHQV